MSTCNRLTGPTIVLLPVEVRKVLLLVHNNLSLRHFIRTEVDKEKLDMKLTECLLKRTIYYTVIYRFISLQYYAGSAIIVQRKSFLLCNAGSWERTCASMSSKTAGCIVERNIN